MADETSTAKREPPEIIFVPPAPLRPPWWLSALILVGSLPLIGFSALMYFLLDMRLEPIALLLVVALGALLLPGGLLEYRSNRRNLHRALADFDARHPGVTADAAVAALSEFLLAGRLPKLRDVRAVLGRHRSSDRARVVCFGRCEPPPVGEYRFEPEIIEPAELTWGSVGPFAAVLGVWLIAHLGAVRPQGPANVLLMLVLLYGVFATRATARWIMRGLLRPTYVRVAPGMIQVMVFRYGKRKPTIRSYPMTAGTVIVWTDTKRGLQIHLVRGEHSDTIKSWEIRRPDERMKRAWQAMLSTAPTPPLSDEELIG